MSRDENIEAIERHHADQAALIVRICQEVTKNNKPNNVSRY
jgi:hypothetical protein